MIVSLNAPEYLLRILLIKTRDSLQPFLDCAIIKDVRECGAEWESKIHQ